MPPFVYNVAKAAFAEGDLDWENDVVRILLLTDATGVDVDHASLADVLDVVGTTEVTTLNYERKTLADGSVTVDNLNDRASLTASTVTWVTIGDGDQSALAAVVYKQVGGNDNVPSTDIPIAFVDFNPSPLVGGDFTIQWHDNGIVTLS